MRKAVENNICPFCGDKIVTDELRKSLSELDTVLIFLLEKFETETLDYLKDRYGISNRPNTHKPVKSYEDDDQYSSDEDDDGEDIENSDLPLSEKLKNKRFRKKYMAASKITGKPTNEFASAMGDDPRHEVDDNDSYVNEGNEVDSALERKLLALASKKASAGGGKGSDLEKLESMVSKSKKSFSPPSF